MPSLFGFSLNEYMESLYRKAREKRAEQSAQKVSVLKNDGAHIVYRALFDVLLMLAVVLLSCKISEDIGLPYLILGVNAVAFVVMLLDIYATIEEKVCFDEAGIYGFTLYGTKKTIYWTGVDEVNYSPVKSLIIEGKDGTKIKFSHVMIGFTDLLDEISERLPREKWEYGVGVFWDAVN